MNAKEYILKNFDKYGLLTQDNQPITQRDMLELLNILESQDETLDTLHAAVISGYDEYMHIWHGGSFESDTELYHIIIENFSFLTDAQFIDYMLELWTDFEHDTDYIIFHDMYVYKTSDGYVIDNRC